MASRAEDLQFRHDLAAALDNEQLADQVLERMPMVPAHNLATKDDLAEFRGEFIGRFGELRGEFGELRGEFGELRGEFGELRGEFGELRGEFGELRGEFGELRGEFGELRGEFHTLRADIADRMRMQTWVVAGLVVSAMGAMGAIAAVT